MKTRSLLLTGAFSLVAASLALALAAPPVGPAAAASAGQTPAYITITVRAGESLATYPRIYGTSGAAILAVNNLADPNRIYPGQTLVIPVVKTFTPSLTTPFYYTAQAVDTLATVARRFELDPAAIARVNGVAELTIGQTYLMPAGPHIYVLRRGDTIASVAARYGTTSQVILDNNTIPNPGVIYAGQELLIPVRFDAQPVAIPDLAPTSTPAPVDDSGHTATPAPTSTPASAVPVGYTQITVQPGDTLVVYVKRFGVSARAIIEANPSLRVNPALLMPGQKLLIPASGTVTPTPAPTLISAATATPLPTSAATATPVPAGAATATAAPATSPYLTVVVRKGESLVTYVSRYGVTASSLLAVNTRLQNNPGLLYPGETLLIPVLASYTPSRTTPFLYLVQAGETAALIATRFGMTSDTFLRANPGVAIAAGTTVLVPAGPHVYKVQKGDELRDVAKLYGTTVEALQTANNLPNPDLIYIDQELLIPIQFNAAPLPFTP